MTEYEDFDEDGEESVEYYAIRPNKTQLKKELGAIFDMVEAISRHKPEQIREFGLPEAIESALLDVAKMGKTATRKRSLKYITAQLKELELVDQVKEHLDRISNKSAHAVREHHQSERWRDLLLSDNGKEQLTRLVDEFPDADVQYVRQLQRNSLKELEQNKPPKSARLLYQYVKELVSNAH